MVGHKQKSLERYGAFLKEDLRPIVSAVREYIDKEVMPVREKLDEDKDRVLVHKIRQGFVALGLQKMSLPSEIGGLGMRSPVDTCIIGEEIGRGDLGIAAETIISGSWIWLPAMHFNNKSVIKKLMAPYAGDKVLNGCMALTEPQGGCNIESVAAQGRAIRTIAKLEGEEWVINGKKRWPSSAGISDVYCTICTTDPNLGMEGVAIIYVPAGTPGLSFGEPERKMGLVYTGVNADIYYDDVRVPKEYRAGGPGLDADALHEIVSAGRLGSSSNVLGNAQAVLEIVLDFTGKRYYGGKPVREHELHAYLLGDLIIAIESARFFMLSVCEMAGRPDVFGPIWSESMMSHASAVKVYVADVSTMVCNKGMELMGSYGYSKEYLVEKYLRDVKMAQLWLAGQQVPRIDVARGYYSMPPYERIEPLREF